MVIREFAPVADVAEEIVHSYLQRLVRLIDEDLLESAWFRITPGRTDSSLELGEVVRVEPVFEVLIFVQEPSPSLTPAMMEAAASMQSRIVVMPEAALAGEWSTDDLKRGDWKHVQLPENFKSGQLAGV
jgi:hypothetical protein